MRGFQSLNYWVYMYRTISSGIHMSQVLSAKRVNGSGSTILEQEGILYAHASIWAVEVPQRHFL